MSCAPLALIPLLALAACAPDGAGKATPATPTEAAAPAFVPPEPPPTWSAADSQVELVLRIDTAVEAHPKLYAQLLEDGRTRLETFGRESRQTRAEAPVSRAAAPWSMEIGYDRPFETGRLVSLQGGSWHYAGGAHGYPAEAAVLWDKTAERRIEPADLFRPGADPSTLDRALCDAVNAAKVARSSVDGNRNVWSPALPKGQLDPNSWNCPGALDIPFALAPGTVASKAGGLIFLIGPYIVGPYAEAGYSVVVPLDAFAALLSPDWADQFAGAPTAETSRLYPAG